MKDRKTITVFGSSIPLKNEPEYETAYRLGTLLAMNGFNVCSGGHAGIMEAVSKAVSENGGEAIGVTLDFVRSSPNKYLTREIKCSALFDRIEKLISLGDAFVVLQGGTGTLLELAAVWELMNKNIVPVKPIACHSSMWREMGKIIDKQIEREKRISGLVRYFEEPAEIVKYLKETIF